MRQIITHFTDDDLYKFTMCCAVIDHYPRTQVKYRFTDRNGTVYPQGFADELRRQIASLEDVAVTDEELDFIRRKCPYIPEWFGSYLKGFRYDRRWVRVEQDADGHLSVEFEGCWCDTILLEVKVLAIISELYYEMTGMAASFDYGDFRRRSERKARHIFHDVLNLDDYGQHTPFPKLAGQKILQMSPIVSAEEEREILARLTDVESGRWSPDFSDLTARGVNKARGLEAVAADRGIDISETMAFGDGGNDLPIVRRAGIGVAMGNAGEALRRAADYVTTSVDADGVSNALRHFGVI